MQSLDDQWISPSFNSYSQSNLAEIAAKVTGEAAGDVQLAHNSFPSIDENNDRNVNGEDEESDFEFSLIINDEFETSGEEIIIDGKSQPHIFPIFNRELLNEFELENHEEKLETIKVPLRKLFIEERESPSSSSSEADEVESIPPGKYCVWRQKAVDTSANTCKKSKSTGFGSKRWKLRDLLRRSNSEGKGSFVFLTPKRKEEKHDSKNKSTISKAAKALLSSKKSTTNTTAAASVPSSPAHRLLYSPANKTLMRGNETPRRKSYLPYRENLVGFFTTVKSLG